MANQNSFPAPINHIDNLLNLAEQGRHVRTESQYNEVEEQEDYIRFLARDDRDNGNISADEYRKFRSHYNKYVLPVLQNLRGGAVLLQPTPLQTVTREKKFIGNVNNIRKNEKK